MNRRNFLRSMLGVAAATALPSEIWPFRKIFLPPDTRLITTRFDILANWIEPSPYPGRLSSPLSEAAIEAVELETFRHQIPDLLYRSTSLYEFFKKRGNVEIGERTATSVIMQEAEAAARIRRLRIPTFREVIVDDDIF